MGSLLGLTFTDFYMSHLENKLLSQNDKKSKPIFYVRYVDDILTVFKTPGNINPLTHMRTQVSPFTEISILF